MASPMAFLCCYYICSIVWPVLLDVGCILSIQPLVHSHSRRLPHLFNRVNLEDFQLLVLLKNKNIPMLALLISFKISKNGIYELR